MIRLATTAAASFAAVMALGIGVSGKAADDHVASLAAFQQMASVMTGPRCMNCHTVTGFPRQGDDRHPHLYGVSRGPDGHGAVGLRCATCHGRANNASSGVPGADDDWHLAPLSMGWEGLSKAGICRELKDPTRNGHRTGAGVIDHLKTHLVMWAFAPGTDQHGRARTLPPIDYATFLKAAQTWVETGEACPKAAT